MFSSCTRLYQYKKITTRVSSISTHLRIKSIQDKPNIGENVTIKGWVKSLRKMKSNIFLDVNDGSCTTALQVLFPAEMNQENLSYGSSVEASGELSLSPKGQLELKAKDVKLIGKCVVADNYPFGARKTYAPEYIRQYLHLRSRTSKQASLLRIRSNATLATHKYFNNENYLHIHTPILTSNDCEGAGEVFSVLPDNKDTLKAMAKKDLSLEETYFNSKAYLTVSGQLHLEAIAHGMSNVYTFGPTFRAENARSTLHLSEFYMIEAEKAFVEDLKEIMDVAENLVKNLTTDLISKNKDDFKIISDGTEINFDWLDKKFGVLEYDEAIDILLKSNKKFSTPVIKNQALSKEHEFHLVEYNNGIPLFVINWPKEIKAFYMKQLPSDNSKVAAFDLLAPGIGELAGGSLRENDYDILKSKLPENSENLNWYLDLRKFGNAPTAGFGLGFERYLQFITGIPNIKDTIPFPRWPHNCSL